METKYISLGCSLTSIPGWVDYFNDELNMKVMPLAEGASGNMAQVHKLKNHIMQHNLFTKLKHTVLLWQVTGPSRMSGLLDDVSINNNYKNRYDRGYTDFYQYNSAIFNDPVLGLLSNNPYFENDKQSVDANFEQFVFDIIVLSKLVKKIVLWYGWRDIYDQNRLSKVNKLFIENHIKIIEPISDYCLNNNLPTSDGMHPSKESSIIWGKNILLPVLKDIG